LKKDERLAHTFFIWFAFLGGLALYVDSLFFHTISESFTVNFPLVGDQFNSILNTAVSYIHHSIWGAILIWGFFVERKLYVVAFYGIILLAVPIWLLQYGGLQWLMNLMVVSLSQPSTYVSAGRFFVQVGRMTST
jgi:hypothetical protein